MPLKKISQVDAYQFKHKALRLAEANRKARNAWCGEYPGGVHIGSVDVLDGLYRSCLTARKLRHAVVVTTATNGQLDFHALPLPEEE